VQTIATEEAAFGRTLRAGSQVFTKKTAGLKKGGVLDGAVIFELYDAYGYPVDLTELMAEELGLTCDMAGCPSSPAPFIMYC
jgi:alanyl-tRNA synthetase